MLYKPGKGKSKPGGSAGKQRFVKVQQPQQQQQQQQQQPQQKQSVQHHNHHRWLRLGHLLSSIGNLSLFGSQHSLASNCSSGAASEQAKAEIDEAQPSCHHDRQVKQHRTTNVAVSCQNLAQLKETLDYDDDWIVGAKLTRTGADGDAAGSQELRRGANRVARWATGLAHLLADTDGVWVFAEFLRSEFSEENVQFWLAVEQFKRLQVEEPGELLDAARRIERIHIGCEAPASVNLDGATERELRRRMNCGELDVGMFNTAQSQTFNLMRLDSYARFLKSTLYKDCLLCELEARPLPTPALQRRGNESPMSMTPPSRAFSQAQRLDVIPPEEADLTKSNRTGWLPQTDGCAGTYRSRQTSFIVAALDLDCGFSVC